MRWKSSTEFEKVGRVSALYVYPVKSFGGLCVQNGKCTKLGLEYGGVRDRHWSVALKDGTWLTQRQEPKMALIKTSLHGDTMHLDAPGMETIQLQINPALMKSNISKITIKTDTVQSLDCGDKVAEWLCRYFNRDGLRLHFSEASLEKRDSHNAKKNWQHPAQPGDLTAFSDYCSYMVLSNSSLKALNQKLDKEVPILNFRANIIADNCDAFAEDDWKEIRIGEARLRALDACTRCILTTVDQSKGVKDKNEEPLATLKKFRLKEPYGPKPAFGINFTLDAPGAIQVGDPIYAIRR
ncbi:hypothetical protein LOTGIDRAFT_134202 [Lottia gigantea]|uniref:MOSC domain-containing protein n=1 Tax=Lottia gigantea TaxID=225164 RepID=V3ZQ19_LOTGI|nr:hypothetical protein LOTGIDRAFT_134202 [Lottia gigantea]ESO82966.1 hypothetical protein LOTGIDRAFT_134202 [Lottia gigantea]